MNQFERYKVYNSLTFKNGTVDGTVVNEYSKMLWAMLKISGFNRAKKNRTVKPIIMHDIDQSVKLTYLKLFTKSIAKNIFQYKNI